MSEMISPVSIGYTAVDLISTLSSRASFSVELGIKSYRVTSSYTITTSVIATIKLYQIVIITISCQ